MKKKYNVIWIDDEWDKMTAFKDECEIIHQIHLEPFRTQKAGMEELDKNLNKWDAVKKQSRIAKRIHVGRLNSDTGEVSLSSRFLELHPEYVAESVFYEDNQLVVRTDAEVEAIRNEAQSDLSWRCDCISFGLTYSLWEMAKRHGIISSLKSVFGEDGLDLLRLGIYELCSHSMAMHNYEDWLSMYYLPDAQPLSGQKISRLLATVTQEKIDDLKIGDSVCTKAYKRAVFNGVSFPIGSRQEDLATMYRIIDKASSVKMIPAVTYYYRINRYGSLTNTKVFENSCDMMFAETERFEFLTDNYPDLAEMIAKNIVYMLTDNIKNIARICRSMRQFEGNGYAKKAADSICRFWTKTRNKTPLKNTDLKHKIFLDMFSEHCYMAIRITGLLLRMGIWR